MKDRPKTSALTGSWAFYDSRSDRYCPKAYRPSWQDVHGKNKLAIHKQGLLQAYGTHGIGHAKHTRAKTTSLSTRDQKHRLRHQVKDELIPCLAWRVEPSSKIHFQVANVEDVRNTNDSSTPSTSKNLDIELEILKAIMQRESLVSSLLTDVRSAIRASKNQSCAPISFVPEIINLEHAKTTAWPPQLPSQQDSNNLEPIQLNRTKRNKTYESTRTKNNSRSGNNAQKYFGVKRDCITRARTVEASPYRENLVTTADDNLSRQTRCKSSSAVTRSSVDIAKERIIKVILDSLERLRKLSGWVAVAVLQWRQQIGQAAPFVYDGRNYLLKMVDDLSPLDSLNGLKHAYWNSCVRFYESDLAVESFSFARNPFLCSKPIPLNLPGRLNAGNLMKIANDVVGNEPVVLSTSCTLNISDRDMEHLVGLFVNELLNERDHANAKQSLHHRPTPIDGYREPPQGSQKVVKGESQVLPKPITKTNSVPGSPNFGTGKLVRPRLKPLEQSVSWDTTGAGQVQSLDNDADALLDPSVVNVPKVRRRLKRHRMSRLGLSELAYMDQDIALAEQHIRFFELKLKELRREFKSRCKERSLVLPEPSTIQQQSDVLKPTKKREKQPASTSKADSVPRRDTSTMNSICSQGIPNNMKIERQKRPATVMSLSELSMHHSAASRLLFNRQMRIRELENEISARLLELDRKKVVRYNYIQQRANKLDAKVREEWEKERMRIVRQRRKLGKFEALHHLEPIQTEYMTMENESATIVQATYRMFRRRCWYIRKIHLRKCKAEIVQRGWRCHIARKRLTQRKLEFNSATSIQAQARRRAKYVWYQQELEKRNAALRIQCGWRCSMARHMRNEKAIARYNNYCATQIQCQVRTTLARMEVARRRRRILEQQSAQVIQSKVRQKLARNALKLKRHQRQAAVMIQCQVRNRQARDTLNRAQHALMVYRASYINRLAGNVSARVITQSIAYRTGVHHTWEHLQSLATKLLAEHMVHRTIDYAIEQRVRHHILCSMDQHIQDTKDEMMSCFKESMGMAREEAEFNANKLAINAVAHKSAAQLCASSAVSNATVNILSELSRKLHGRMLWTKSEARSVVFEAMSSAKASALLNYKTEVARDELETFKCQLEIRAEDRCKAYFALTEKIAEQRINLIRLRCSIANTFVMSFVTQCTAKYIADDIRRMARKERDEQDVMGVEDVDVAEIEKKKRKLRQKLEAKVLQELQTLVNEILSNVYQPDGVAKATLGALSTGAQQSWITHTIKTATNVAMLSMNTKNFLQNCYQPTKVSRVICESALRICVAEQFTASMIDQAMFQVVQNVKDLHLARVSATVTFVALNIGVSTTSLLVQGQKNGTSPSGPDNSFCTLYEDQQTMWYPIENIAHRFVEQVLLQGLKSVTVAMANTVDPIHGAQTNTSTVVNANAEEFSKFENSVAGSVVETTTASGLQRATAIHAVARKAVTIPLMRAQTVHFVAQHTISTGLQRAAAIHAVARQAVATPLVRAQTVRSVAQHTISTGLQRATAIHAVARQTVVSGLARAQTGRLVSQPSITAGMARAQTITLLSRAVVDEALEKSGMN